MTQYISISQWGMFPVPEEKPKTNIFFGYWIAEIEDPDGDLE